eukprot:scaffold77701_cov14-Prasinocladus_malaysianus.AAC.1
MRASRTLEDRPACCAMAVGWREARILSSLQAIVAYIAKDTQDMVASILPNNITGVSEKVGVAGHGLTWIDTNIFARRDDISLRQGDT